MTILAAAAWLAIAAAPAEGTEAGSQPPDTRIVKGAKKVSFVTGPRFRFVARGAAGGARFECALDGGSFRRCRSPLKLRKLKPGRHRLRVRAVGADGGADRSPATYRFRVESRRVVFGRSVRGRPLVARRIGNPAAKRKALVVGSVHGDEIQGERITERLLRKFRRIGGVDLWLVRSVNPDGVAAGTRKNARGVDLNRNFGHRWSGAEPPGSGYHGGARAFSEPESRAVRKLVRRLKPRVTVWYHQPWGAVLVPCSGKAKVQRRYARIAGMPTSCRGAGLPGTAIGWQNNVAGGGKPGKRGTAFVVELGARPLTSAQVRRHTRAAARVSRRGAN